MIRLGPGALPGTAVRALRLGAVLAPAEATLIALEGAGAVSCLQGLLTNDVEKPGAGSFVYGALLTPKGMMVTDGWAGIHSQRVTYTVPRAGHAAALEIFTRSIPPRLAKIVDRSETSAVLRLAGPRAIVIAEVAGVPIPEGPGRIVAGRIGTMPVEVGRASELAPFTLQIVMAAAHLEAIAEQLAAAGAVRVGPAILELARILGGWPGLTTEVDDRTIPQEVRLDEIGGVSYTKGCYTGQETVSRLHFRGHTNRRLRGLLFDAEPPVTPAEGWQAVAQEDKDVGRVTSLAWVPEGDGGAGRWIGLGLLRREVEPGAMVRAAGRDARVVDLPFSLPHIGPA